MTGSRNPTQLIRGATLRVSQFEQEDFACRSPVKQFHAGRYKVALDAILKPVEARQSHRQPQQAAGRTTCHLGAMLAAIPTGQRTPIDSSNDMKKPVWPTAGTRPRKALPLRPSSGISSCKSSMRRGTGPTPATGSAWGSTRSGRGEWRLPRSFRQEPLLLRLRE